MSLSDEIYETLRGDTYSMGAIETVEDSERNTRKTLSNLIELLVDKGVITKTEVKEVIIDTYDFGEDWENEEEVK